MCYRIDRSRISYLKFILEAYDHMGGITTLDRSKGLVRIFMAPGCERDVLALVDDLSGEILMEKVEDETGDPCGKMPQKEQNSER